MELYKDQMFDEERALYGKDGICVISCRFDGPADGESALKECKNVKVQNCFFNLRYPFWHDDQLCIQNADLTEFCRAALWYSKDIRIASCKLHGIKAPR